MRRNKGTELECPGQFLLDLHSDSQAAAKQKSCHTSEELSVGFLAQVFLRTFYSEIIWKWLELMPKK